MPIIQGRSLSLAHLATLCPNMSASTSFCSFAMSHPNNDNSNALNRHTREKTNNHAYAGCSQCLRSMSVPTFIQCNTKMKMEITYSPLRCPGPNQTTKTSSQSTCLNTMQVFFPNKSYQLCSRRGQLCLPYFRSTIASQASPPAEDHRPSNLVVGELGEMNSFAANTEHLLSELLVDGSARFQPLCVWCRNRHEAGCNSAGKILNGTLAVVLVAAA